MRLAFTKLSKIFTFIFTTGILGLIISLIYSTGMASSSKEFFGFGYQSLFGISITLIIFGLIPSVTMLDDFSKEVVNNSRIYLLLSFLIGIIYLFMSLIYYGQYLPSDYIGQWFDYFLFGAVISICALSLMLSSFTEANKRTFFSLRFVYILLVLLGFIFIIVSDALYGSFIQPETTFGIGMDAFFLYGSYLTIMGLILLFLTSNDTFSESISKGKIIYVIVFLVGIIITGLSMIVYNGQLVDLSFILGDNWLFILLNGIIVTLLGGIPLVSSEDVTDFLSKLSIIWMILIIVDIVLFLISFLFFLPSSPLGMNNIAGIGWDGFYLYAMGLLIIDYLFIGSILNLESKSSSQERPSSIKSSGISIFNFGGTSEETITFLNLVKANQGKISSDLKDAVRDDKLSPKSFEKLMNYYKKQDKRIDSKIKRLETKLGKKPTKTKTIFDSALGLEIGEIKETSKSAPAPSGPPMPGSAPSPAPAPSGPPMPGSAPSPAPAPSGPPMPGSAPIPKPTPTPTSAAPGDQSPLDAVADARSTSIAELRGEMLKELRRLRDIFKEE